MRPLHSTLVSTSYYLPCPDPPYELHIDHSIKPFAIHSPVTVPLHFEKRVKRDLDRDVLLGVIEPVPENTPVTWCARMHVVGKNNIMEPRCVIDLKILNYASIRQTHHTKPAFQQIEKIPDNQYQSCCDCWNGYHSVVVHKEDRHYLTFITPWGRYRYCSDLRDGWLVEMLTLKGLIKFLLHSRM